MPLCIAGFPTCFASDDRSWLVQREPRDGWARSSKCRRSLLDMRLYWAFRPKDGAPAKPLAGRVSIEEIPPAPTHVPVEGDPRAKRHMGGTHHCSSRHIGGTHHCSLWKRPLELTLALGGRLLLARRASINKKLVPVFGACSQAMRSCGRHAHGLHPSGQ